MCPNVCRLVCRSNNYTWRTLPTGGEWRDKSLGVEEGEKKRLCCVSIPTSMCACRSVCACEHAKCNSDDLLLF